MKKSPEALGLVLISISFVSVGRISKSATLLITIHLVLQIVNDSCECLSTIHVSVEFGHFKLQNGAFGPLISTHFLVLQPHSLRLVMESVPEACNLPSSRQIDMAAFGTER